LNFKSFFIIRSNQLQVVCYISNNKKQNKKTKIGRKNN